MDQLLASLRQAAAQRRVRRIAGPVAGAEPVARSMIHAIRRRRRVKINLKQPEAARLSPTTSSRCHSVSGCFECPRRVMSFFPVAVGLSSIAIPAPRDAGPKQLEVRPFRVPTLSLKPGVRGCHRKWRRYNINKGCDGAGFKRRIVAPLPGVPMRVYWPVWYRSRDRLGCPSGSRRGGSDPV